MGKITLEVRIHLELKINYKKFLLGCLIIIKSVELFKFMLDLN